MNRIPQIFLCPIFFHLESKLNKKSESTNRTIEIFQVVVKKNYQFIRHTKHYDKSPPHLTIFVYRRDYLSHFEKRDTCCCTVVSLIVVYDAQFPNFPINYVPVLLRKVVFCCRNRSFSSVNVLKHNMEYVQSAVCNGKNKSCTSWFRWPVNKSVTSLKFVAVRAYLFEDSNTSILSFCWLKIKR